MNNSMNYYELLGVERTSTAEEIKNAYKKQMKIWHPDRNKSEDAVSMSSKINEAKEILLDENKRKEYDEYLDKKVKENYNRYTQNKKNAESTNNEYKESKVTKWQYLNDWLNYANLSFTRKMIGLVGVLLESLLCLVIKYLLILISFILFFLSELIISLYSYLAVIIFAFGFITIGNYVIKGYNQNDILLYKTFIGTILVFLLSYIFPIIGTKLLSEKIFNFLYNKIDISLFKICVGYNKN